MTTADYYPERARLDFIGNNGTPTGGHIGPNAHFKAAELFASGSAIVRIVLDSRMNRQRRHRTQCPFEGLSIGQLRDTN